MAYSVLGGLSAIVTVLILISSARADGAPTEVAGAREPVERPADRIDPSDPAGPTGSRDRSDAIGAPEGAPGANAIPPVDPRAPFHAIGALVPPDPRDPPAPSEPPVPPAPPDPIDAAGPPPLVVPGPLPHERALNDRVRAGRHWRLATSRGPVHVWIPAHYDAATAAAVVFVHGYWIDVDGAWDSYQLAQQFALSGINAMFIAPSAPSAKWESIAWPSLRELVRTVGDHVDVEMPARRLVAAGHSGAYRTLALWLANPALDTVLLFDAVYAEYSFAPWARQSRQHRLINIVYETGRFSDWLHRQLPGTRRIDGLPLGGLPDARILYVKTDVGHWQLVTDGVALPLALRAIGVPFVPLAPLDLPLGIPQRCDVPAAPRWPASVPFALPFSPPIIELSPDALEARGAVAGAH